MPAGELEETKSTAPHDPSDAVAPAWADSVLGVLALSSVGVDAISADLLVRVVHGLRTDGGLLAFAVAMSCCPGSTTTCSTRSPGWSSSTPAGATSSR